MCKHIHLSMLVAASRDINLEKERILNADEIFGSGQFFYDINNNQVEVVSLTGVLSIVNLDSNTCNCFASSHGILCVCRLVAKRVVPCQNNDNDQGNIEVAIQLPEKTLEMKIEHKFNQIGSLIKGEKIKYMSEKKKKSVLKCLNQIYAQCYTSNFAKKSTKRKQAPLFPNRNTKKPKTDHLYTTTTKEKCKKSNTKVNEDGSFRMTGRRKGNLRKPFQ